MAKPQVGILSMQKILNYGSFLQAYGLKQILLSLECDVQFVDYSPGKCLVDPKGGDKSVLVRKALKVLEALGNDSSFRNKLAFIQYKRTYAQRFYPMLELTEKPNLFPDLDLLVIGSDEVFNCVQSNVNVGYAPQLFGQGYRARRKVSYAASFGNTTIAKLDKFGKRDEVAGWLRELDAISVRDDNSGAIISELTGSEPSYNLDPVLAYDFMSECDEIPSGVDEKKPYLIVYGYSGRFSKEECMAIRSYADKWHLRILNIGGVQSACDRFVDCSPFEVIAYFAHAKAAVTDTFHGTILSVMTHTPFVSFVRGEGYGNSQKLTDLLKRLHLEDRFCNSPELLSKTLSMPIVWQEADAVIATGRESARSYLGDQVKLCQREESVSRASFLNTGRAADCTGCGACARICPTDAISMAENACGFVLPTVSESACMHCGRCAKVCHMLNPGSLKRGFPLACYGAVELDQDSLRHSASGGAATVLSKQALSKGHIVYGCVADREDVHHERITDSSGLIRTQGSKYVQSDITRVFGPIEEDLKAGRDVTFVGTPCQCAAVRKLFDDHERLVTIDLVCEGVPSNRMYADFLDDLERDCGEKVTDFRFRDKRGGWSTKNAVVVGEEGRPLDVQYHSYYYYYYWLFSKALILRDSCYECPYACSKRVGDVTVGDFWGVETAKMRYRLSDIEAGISCLLVNSAKGEAAVRAASPGMKLNPCSEDAISRANAALRHASTCDWAVRNDILANYKNHGAEGMKSVYSRLFGSGERRKADIVVHIPVPLKVVAKMLVHALKGVDS